MNEWSLKIMFTVELIDDVQESVEAELTQLLADRLQISLRSILMEKIQRFDTGLKL